MSELVRFGVSIEKNPLESFDRFITDHGFFNRSEAIRDLIREKLSLEKGFKSVTIICNHPIRTLAENLTDIEHRFQRGAFCFQTICTPPAISAASSPT